MAIQNYIDKLLNGDKEAFQSATDIIEMLAGKSRTSIDIPRTQQMLQGVKEFLGFIARCTPHNPRISSFGMGGLNCIMTVSTYPINVSQYISLLTPHGQLTLENIDCFDKLTHVIKRIGDHLSNLSHYAPTGIASKQVQEVRVLYSYTYGFITNYAGNDFIF